MHYHIFDEFRFSRKYIGDEFIFHFRGAEVTEVRPADGARARELHRSCTWTNFKVLRACERGRRSSRSVPFRSASDSYFLSELPEKKGTFFPRIFSHSPNRAQFAWLPPRIRSRQLSTNATSTRLGGSILLNRIRSAFMERDIAI